MVSVKRALHALDAVNKVVETARTAIQGKRWRGGSKRYCAVVTLDIKNAFNSARWSCIHQALEKMNVPLYIRRIVADYFGHRLLRYDTDDGPVESREVFHRARCWVLSCGT